MKYFKSNLRGVLAGAAFVMASLAAAPIAQAAIVFNGSPGNGAPPATLGGYKMTPSPQDTRADYTTVSNAPATPTSSFSFSPSTELRTIGTSWYSTPWAGGTYSGRVYFTSGASSLTITLPTPSNAVYLYAAPNPYGTWNMQATANDGTTSGPIPVNTNDSETPSGQYFGFYGTGGSKVSSITMTFVGSLDTVNQQGDFAVGDFALSTTGGQPSSTYVYCTPTTVKVGTRTLCSATVTSNSSNQSGTVTFSSDSPGSFSSTTCTLVSLGGNRSRCTVYYTPSAVSSGLDAPRAVTSGTHTITGTYSGNSVTAPSSGTATVTVWAPQPQGG